MANLIPPDAKRAVRVEYWLRVVTVWLVMLGVALLVVGILKLPTYWLIESQLRAFSGDYNKAVDMTTSFEAAEAELAFANELSGLLIENDESTPFSEMIDIIDTLAGAHVAVNSYQFDALSGDLEKVIITGVANTRQALLNFNKAIEAHELFAEAKLPISNLAKDKDIPFSIEITLAP